MGPRRGLLGPARSHPTPTGPREATDTALLGEILTANLGSREFFINKSLGWALRDYSKTNPDWVRGFLARHEVSALTRREASKYL